MGTTLKQDKAIALLLTGAQQQDVAAQLGINEKTLRRWLADPAFRSALADQRGALARAALGKLQGLADQAVETLRGLLADENPHVRYKAAAFIIDQAANYLDLEQLERDVEELKQWRDAAG